MKDVPAGDNPHRPAGGAPFKRGLLGREPPGRQGGQALAGPHTQKEGLNCGKFQAFVHGEPNRGRELVMHQVEVEAVIFLFLCVDLESDVVGVEPEQ